MTKGAVIHHQSESSGWPTRDQFALGIEVEACDNPARLRSIYKKLRKEGTLLEIENQEQHLDPG
jgi:hypothetical protein